MNNPPTKCRSVICRRGTANIPRTRTPPNRWNCVTGLQQPTRLTGSIITPRRGGPLLRFVKVTRARTAIPLGIRYNRRIVLRYRFRRKRGRRISSSVVRRFSTFSVTPPNVACAHCPLPSHVVYTERFIYRVEAPAP